jgi:hypothetical protein
MTAVGLYNFRDGNVKERRLMAFTTFRRKKMPLPNCIGLSREDWCKKEVALMNDSGVP